MGRISLTLIATLIAASLAMLPIAGCAHQTDEEAIESSIAKRLDSYKNPDSTEAANFAVRMDIDSLAQYGVSMEDFMRSYLDGFDYVIDDVAVDGNTATATVTIRCKSFSAYEEALAQATDEMKQDPAFATMSTEKLKEEYGSAILDTLAGVEVRETEPISIVFEKTDNVWTPVSEASDDIAEALMSN